MQVEKPLKSLDPRTLAKLKGLHLRAQHIVEGYVAGLHRSPYHGFSIEFSEHREYAPGDDLRRLDWRVLARTDRHYVKEYEEESNVRATIVLDASASMRDRDAASSWSDGPWTAVRSRTSAATRSPPTCLRGSRCRCRPRR